MAVPRAQEFIEKSAKERASFIAWVRSVPADKWTSLSPDGAWQARDYVAHLASIDPLLAGIMRSFQREAGFAGEAGSAGRFDIDEWNEGQILERRPQSMEELIAEMEKHRVQLNEAAREFTEEQLDRSFRFGGDAKRSPRDVKVHEFLRGLAYHDRWHMEDARRAIEGEAEQPFGDGAWESMMRKRPGP